MWPGVHAQAWPDKPAVIVEPGGARLTYGELDAQSNRCARLFRRLGLKAGDAIAFMIENQAQLFVVAWAAQRSGLFFAPISTHLTPDEAAYIVADSGARAVVSSKAGAAVAGALPALVPGVAHWLMIDGVEPGFASFEAAIAGESPDPLPDESEGSALLYSSGTTGRPKGVYRKPPAGPMGQDSTVQTLIIGLYGGSGDAVYLSPGPLYHAAPLNFTMRFQRLGATVVVMEKFDALLALQLIEKHHITHSQWVPTHFIRMLKLPQAVRRGFDLSSHRCAVHAAAPCPIPVKETMIGWWGPILWEYYAGSERNGLTSIDSPTWLAHKGSVGQAVIGRVRIVGDDGQECAAGEEGVIYFEGGPAFAYHNDPAKTASAHNAQGWSTLFDVGYLDRDGYLYLTDRKAHMIISGGVNIYPQEAENLLVTHPKVTDVAVIGVPNAEFGEEVKAVVQLVDPASASPETAAELISFCRAHLSHIKCPRSVDFEVELPRLPSGKLAKHRIKARYWEGHKTRIV
ncbi:MAG: AMP-binding protein [Alphaproteobacteria bacterium]